MGLRPALDAKNCLSARCTWSKPNAPGLAAHSYSALRRADVATWVTIPKTRAEEENPARRVRAQNAVNCGGGRDVNETLYGILKKKFNRRIGKSDAREAAKYLVRVGEFFPGDEEKILEALTNLKTAYTKSQDIEGSSDRFMAWRYFFFDLGVSDASVGICRMSVFRSKDYRDAWIQKVRQMRSTLEQAGRASVEVFQVRSEMR